MFSIHVYSFCVFKSVMLICMSPYLKVVVSTGEITLTSFERLN